MIYEEVLVLAKPFDEVLDAVKKAFASEGFGTLTEIDVQATLREKTGKQMGRYVIVGSCNPDLAGRAIDALPGIGVLLPCNVVVREAPEGVVVEALDPGLMATVTETSAIRPIADEARERIGRAMETVGAVG